MLERDAIVLKVNAILVEEFELAPDDVRPDAHLYEDLDLDSLDAVDLIAALESAFGHRVAEEQAREVRTVGDVYALIERTAQAQAS